MNGLSRGLLRNSLHVYTMNQSCLLLRAWRINAPFILRKKYFRSLAAVSLAYQVILVEIEKV